MAKIVIKIILLFLFSQSLAAGDLAQDTSNSLFKDGNFITVKDGEIKLKAKKSFGSKEYYASINNGDAVKINKAQYKLINLLKGKAALSHQEIRLDLDLMSNSKTKAVNFNEHFYLVEKPPTFEISDLICCVCMDERRSIFLEPCRHLCLCEKCEKQLSESDKKCPLCRAVYKDKKEVYF